jgi:hypothetical protein
MKWNVTVEIYGQQTMYIEEGNTKIEAIRNAMYNRNLNNITWITADPCEFEIEE